MGYSLKGAVQSPTHPQAGATPQPHLHLGCTVPGLALEVLAEGMCEYDS